MSLLAHARMVGSTAGGQVLATATRSLAAIRPAAKPLHPEGELLSGRLYRCGAQPTTGVAWLDETGDDDVVVRLSRAIGLPGALPDIHGLALRVPVGDAYGDVLFASTGWGRLSRFVLTASRSPRDRPMTTLLPYKSPAGPLLLGLCATGAHTYELACALYDDDWRPFADLRLSTPVDTDEDVSFDPVRNQLPDLEQYATVEKLREPSYSRARSSRR